MKRSILLTALQSLFILVLVLVGIFLTSRFWPISSAQKQALEALQPVAQDFPGKNAYTALATLAIDDLTPAQRQARVDAFIPKYVRWQDDYFAKTDNKTATHAPPAAPTLQTESDHLASVDDRLCRFKDAASCLAKLRKQPAADTLVAQQALVARVAELAEYGHYQQPPALLPGIDTTLPKASLLAAPLATHAQAYLQGDTQGALNGLCRDAMTGRMLMAHADNLLLAMVGGAMLSSNAELLASITAELPTNAALPPSCERALATLTVPEMSTCTAMRGEFAMGKAYFDGALKKEFSKIKAEIFFNADKTIARNAEIMGWPCLPKNLQRIAKDNPLPPPPSLSLYKLECASNYIGCVLSAIAAPTYSDYVARQQDAAAQLRLVQAVLWLRQQSDAQTNLPIAQRLKALPTYLQQSPRQIRVSRDGLALELPAYAKNGLAKPVSIPLPTALLSTAAPRTAAL